METFIITGTNVVLLNKATFPAVYKCCWNISSNEIATSLILKDWYHLKRYLIACATRSLGYEIIFMPNAAEHEVLKCS